MSVPKPGGPHSAEVLDFGARPDVDEDALSDRADSLTEKLRKVTSTLISWQHQQGELFEPSTWSGHAAGAASTKISTAEINPDAQAQIQNVEAAAHSKNLAELTKAVRLAVCMSAGGSGLMGFLGQVRQK